MEKITTSLEETEQFGIEFASKLNGGDIVLLSGNLGAGKTALVKGIAKGFGIQNTITSPTFTLLNIYKIKNSKIKNFVHIDTYRLKNEQELVEIGAEDYLGRPNTICLIEWPDKIENVLKKYADPEHSGSSILDFAPQQNRDNQKKFISIEIKQLENPDEREIIWKEN